MVDWRPGAPPVRTVLAAWVDAELGRRSAGTDCGDSAVGDLALVPHGNGHKRAA